MENGMQSYAIFVVRDDKRVEQPDVTFSYLLTPIKHTIIGLSVHCMGGDVVVPTHFPGDSTVMDAMVKKYPLLDPTPEAITRMPLTGQAQVSI